VTNDRYTTYGSNIRLNKTWTKKTIIIVIVVAISYGMWFNLIDSLAYCQQLDNKNHFDHTCTSIGEIFGGICAIRLGT